MEAKKATEPAKTGEQKVANTKTGEPAKAADKAEAASGNALVAMLQHQDKLMGLIGANEQDPAKAEAAVDAYLKDNAAAIGKIRAANKKLQEEVKTDPNKAAELMEGAAGFAEQAKSVMEKMMGFMKNKQLAPIVAKISSAFN